MRQVLQVQEEQAQGIFDSFQVLHKDFQLILRLIIVKEIRKFQNFKFDYSRDQDKQANEEILSFQPFLVSFLANITILNYELNGKFLEFWLCCYIEDTDTQYV